MALVNRPKKAVDLLQNLGYEVVIVESKGDSGRMQCRLMTKDSGVLDDLLDGPLKAINHDGPSAFKGFPIVLMYASPQIVVDQIGFAYSIVAKDFTTEEEV